jgi:hypothetical protein
MPAKCSPDRKKNISAEYLELHIDENGKVEFFNLSRSAVKLVEKISGIKQDQPDFYCG